MVELHPLDAYELTRKDTSVLLIDVRSESEYLFVGHAESAINVPWHVEPDWEVNAYFCDQLLRATGSMHRPVILMCRNGNRARAAASCAEVRGFTHVHVMCHGFEGEIDAHKRRGTVNGWRYEGLPWEQC